MAKIVLPEISVWSTSRIILATLMVLLIAAGFWLLYQIRWVVFIFFIALVIGTALKPVVDWLRQQGVSQILSMVLVYVLLLVILIGFVVLLVPTLVEQGVMFVNEIPTYYSQFRTMLTNSSSLVLQQLFWRLPPELPIAAFSQPAEQEATDTMVQNLSSLGLFFKGTSMVIATLMLSFYWLLEGPRALQIFMLMIPIRRRDHVRELIKAIEAKVGGYLRGQIILCVVVGGMNLVAYTLIGLPDVLILALFAGVMEILPIIGPVLGAVPAILIAATIGFDKVIWVIVAMLIIQQLENAFLLPRVMNSSVGVHPIGTLLALFALGSVLGVWGAILAVPVGAIIQLLLDRYIFEPALLKEEESIGRDEFSLLRYEAQELARDVRRQARHKGTSDYEESLDHLEEEIEAMVADLDHILAHSKAAEVTL